MTLFRLDTPHEARLATFTARTEKHGEADVAALTLGLSITGPNLLLDKVSETLRHAFYRVADDYTEALENIDPPTTVLRTKQLTGPLPITVPEIKGGTLYVEWGIGEDMVFGDVTLKAWKAECFEGGSVTLSFKASTSDIDEEEAGRLFGKQGQAIMIRFTPPLPVADNTGDDNGAPLFEEPSEARLAAEAAFVQRITDCPTCGPSEFDREEGTATCLGCGWTTRVSFQPGAEGMDPNKMRAFPGAVDGEDDGQDAGEHVADDVERNGEGATARTPAQIRGAKAAATRKARAAAGA
jgi:hypothetical protein